MKIPLKWLTPVILRLLSLSHVTLASPRVAAALQSIGSVHLVAGFHVGLAANPQPHDLSLDSSTYFQLTSQEFTFPVMPLHLLGKKSWNVYNQDNITRVKRDEATAAAAEAAEEERMQEIDSERRIQILRGEQPTPLAIEGPPSPTTAHDLDLKSHHPPSSTRDRSERKKRKRPNEDDTDFELRIARDQANGKPTSSSASHRPAPSSSSSNAPLTDPTGHISLFPPPSTAPHNSKAAANPDAERDAARQRREYEDQYTMRFSNAAGYKSELATGPWYSKSRPSASTGAVDGEGEGKAGSAGSSTAGQGANKNVWGNEDPRRAAREAARVEAGDPLMAMRRGALGVRRVEAERKRWRAEREGEVGGGGVDAGEMEGRRKRRRREQGKWEEGLEGFALDRLEDGNRLSSSRRGRSDKENRREGLLLNGHRDGERSRNRDRDRDSDRHRRHHRH